MARVSPRRICDGSCAAGLDKTWPGSVGAMALALGNFALSNLIQEGNLHNRLKIIEWQHTHLCRTDKMSIEILPDRMLFNRKLNKSIGFQ